MEEYRKNYRAEGQPSPAEINAALDAGIKSAPYIETSAVHAKLVETAIFTALRELGAKNITEIAKPTLKTGESLTTPRESRRVGASETGGLMGEISVQQITNAIPPQYLVSGWYRHS